MTVQLPLILWTVICFFAFVLIINNLLFKPVLAVMDKRRKRVEDAEKKKESDAALLEEAAARRQANLEEAIKLAQREEKLKEEQAEKDAAASIEKTQKSGYEKLIHYQEQTELDKAEYQKKLTDGAAGLVQAFAKGFTGESEV